ncbi:hypothetical protein [Nocardioides lijunqiniae]|uniref:hypothetical protein n=1 Tax=Nocardioides lijunqiniae TaxID=2760832 RepID=UPI001877E184|nr:hypothetical protein [Nocardioides lijunqiniae]
MDPSLDDDVIEIAIALKNGDRVALRSGFANHGKLTPVDKDSPPSQEFGFHVTANGDLVIQDHGFGSYAYAAGSWSTVQHHRTSRFAADMLRDLTAVQGSMAPPNDEPPSGRER